MSRALLLRLRAELKAAGDPARAPQMQAYMKSKLPFHGVPAPAARRIFRRVFADIDFENAAEWKKTIVYIWHNAQFREEWYAAITLCQLRKFAGFQTADALPMYEEMIVTGAWWDVVDTIASHSVGLLLRRYRREIGREMRAWSRSGNLWKRRTAILCQLGFKKDTDLRLLYGCIRPSLDSKEFFLRKAIGWALRQYAWVDPMEVRRYVHANADKLSPLSKREALKNIAF
jgi:3-methyladenine DNA glycosylase AlkD